jgi:hypothetical protein
LSESQPPQGQTAGSGNGRGHRPAKGTGLDGRVTDMDVQAYAAGRQSTSGEVAATLLRFVRQPGLQGPLRAGARSSQPAWLEAALCLRLLSREVDHRLRQLGLLRLNRRRRSAPDADRIWRSSLHRVLQKHPE